MSSRHILALAALGLLLACSAGDALEGAGAKGAKAAAPAGAPARGARKFPVEVAPVAAREMSYRVVSVGSLEASDVVNVTARVSGVAEKVAFREGDVVRPDDVLVEIEPERFRLALAQAAANLARAEAMAREAEAALAKREQLRAKDPGWVSGEELTSLQSRLDVARAEVAQAKASADLAELNHRHAFLKAGVPGEVQTRALQTGQHVTAGTVLATLVRTDPLYVRFQVSEREAGSLAKGTACTFTARANPERVRHATIVHVADAADPRTRRVECLAMVTGEIEDLRPGYFVEITIATGVSRSVAVVPEGSLRPTERGFVVYVVEDGKAVERVVETGLGTEDGHMEVRSGVTPGESLVTRGAHYLRAGAEVEVKQP